MTPGYAVLAGRSADPEFDALERALRVVGVPSVRLGRGAALLDGGDVVIADRRVRPTVCWIREDLGGVQLRPGEVFGRESWSAFAGRVEALADVAVPGPRAGLLTQLDRARRCGVRVPRTVVSTDPAGAALPGERLVVKVLHRHFVGSPGTTLYAALPQLLDRAEVVSRSWPGWPVVVQEYVPHESEQRVYYAGGRVVAFEVSKPAPDALWTRPRAVGVREVAIGAEAGRVVRLLAGEWQVRYGAFDLLLTRDGVVFLELNHDGDWRWYESRAGSRSVTTAVTSMVRDLHGSAGGAAAGFDLLSFLAS